MGPCNSGYRRASSHGGASERQGGRPLSRGGPAGACSRGWAGRQTLFRLIAGAGGAGDLAAEPARMTAAEARAAVAAREPGFRMLIAGRPARLHWPAGTQEAAASLTAVPERGLRRSPLSTARCRASRRWLSKDRPPGRNQKQKQEYRRGKRVRLMKGRCAEDANFLPAVCAGTPIRFPRCLHLRLRP